MTTPLEAAAKALIDDVRRRHPGGALRCSYMIALDKALTAAAEVGEQDNDLNSVLLGFTNYVMNERVRAYNEGVDATIERCAMVADDMAYVETCADDTARGTANAAPYRKVAAEIRAMKDKP